MQCTVFADVGWPQPGKYWYCTVLVLLLPWKKLASNSANKSPNSLRIDQIAHPVDDAVVTGWCSLCTVDLGMVHAPSISFTIRTISRRELRAPLLRTCLRLRLTLEGKRGRPRDHGRGVSTKGDKSLHIIHIMARVHPSAAKPCALAAAPAAYRPSPPKDN